jgi:hypothetical protein
MNQDDLPTSQLPNTNHQSIIDQEIVSSANCIDIKPEILQLWLEQYQCEQTHVLLSFLHLIKKYQLDPLADELSILKNPDGSHHVFITVDGWYKIMNQHAQFAGMSLRESNEISHDKPLWMECTIYRNDRILPIVVKEYLSEVITDQVSWQEMPLRMLRHRVIQQCARLAFGISSPESKPSKNLEKEVNAANKTGIQTVKPLEQSSQIERLKQKLVNS